MTIVTHAVIPPVVRRRSPSWVFVARLFREKPLGAAGAVIFVLFLLCGVFADFLAPYGYNHINPINRLKPPSWQFPTMRRASQKTPMSGSPLPRRSSAGPPTTGFPLTTSWLTHS